MEIITNENLFDFCRVYDWIKKLDELENIIIPERWSFVQENKEAKNKKNPILANYIIHTFKRLHHVCERNEGDGEKLLYCENGYLCFNIGLFTEHYERIFMLLKQEEKKEDDKKWSLVDFVKESDYRIFDFEFLPIKVPFIEKIDDLIYDTNLELRINSAHILSDENNISRLPETIRDKPNLQTLFDGAITQVKKKIEANYKIAVPQYYNGKTQLLLPLCLQDPNTVDIVLTVERKANSYAGRTCLTLDMAYNNARLVAKPETPWLARTV